MSVTLVNLSLSCICPSYIRVVVVHIFWVSGAGVPFAPHAESTLDPRMVVLVFLTGSATKSIAEMGIDLESLQASLGDSGVEASPPPTR